MDTPKEFHNVMVTYSDNVRVRDKYYDHLEKQIVTRRAFYSKSKGYYNTKNEYIETPDGYFSVPQFWQNFVFSDGSIALLPHTFYSHGRVMPKDVIGWKYDN